MVGIASAATAVVIGHVAGGTPTDPRRRGRHHAAEPCAAGRSPSSSARSNRSIPAASISASAARPAPTSAPCARCAATPPAADTFPQDVLELQALLGPAAAGPARPGRAGRRHRACRSGSSGSSLFGAQLAAMLGLPYAFASHFAPDALMPALQVYRERFEPSAQLAQALRDGRRQRHRGRDRCRGAAAVHLGAAVLHQPVPRHARPAPAADRRHRDLLVAGREGAGVGDARLLVRRLARDGAGRARGLHRARPAPTS